MVKPVGEDGFGIVPPKINVWFVWQASHPDEDTRQVTAQFEALK